MVTFINKHNCIFDKETLSNAVEWYANIKGVILRKKQKSLYVYNTGYICVCIGSGNNMLVHRLLMMYHLGRVLSSKELVHHRDGDILNCVLSNLSLTNKPRHTAYHKLRADVPTYEIAEMLMRGRKVGELARYFGCSQSTIYQRVKRM